MKKITVVTVCYNAENTIKDTIESIISQNYNDYEYLLIDGKSTDKTYEIIKSYEKKFKEKKITYRHISEKDNGIFDAMNKAAMLSDGKWIIYMNADDTFCASDVLSKLDGYLLDDYDVVYGNTMRINSNGKEYSEAKDFEVIYKNMPFCHQSCLTKTSVMREYKFDLNYRVADYHFFLRLALDKKKFEKVPVMIANYSTEGYSNKNKYKTYMSILDIKNDLGIINKNSLKQKIKNIYFFVLINDNNIFNKIIKKIDRKFFGKR